MQQKFKCDDCGKKLGTYLYGKGGVAEKAVVTFSNNSTVPIYEKCEGWIVRADWKEVGKKEIEWGWPDITCFSCTDNRVPSDLGIKIRGNI